MAIDKINSNALTDSTVVAADIADGTITSAKLAGSIANAKLSNNSITVNGQTINLGATGSIPDVQWQSVVVSDGSTVTTMVAGRGYFINNASAAGIVKLPASASAGDTIRIKDYAGNFGTNVLTIQRNGHNIQGSAVDSEISTDRTAIALVYADATKGWLYSVLSTPGNFGKLYHSATGGTVTTSGNFKIHSFTGDGNFVVSSVGNAAGSGTKVSYTVVAGGAGGGGRHGGGGGAGGFREGRAPNDSYAVSPLNAPDGLTISAQTYPITVGGGGTGISGAPYEATATNGGNSVFSTITSTGGGHGGGYPSNTAEPGGSGGGGGGSLQSSSNGGSGNTPPVSPPQGNNGGSGASGGCSGAGGGGATAASSNTPVSGAGTAGGAGAENSITGSPVTRSGGGGGVPTGPPVPGGGTVAGGAGGGGYGVGNNNQNAQSGTANTGGGGGGNRSPGGVCGTSGGGGSGIVIIRYKYQN